MNNIFAIDHGNDSIKTMNTTFPCGLRKDSEVPYATEDYIEYNGNFYTLSSIRQHYMEDKTINEDYLIYTLFAYCKEIEKGGINANEPVVLAIGLPPNYLALNKEKMIVYFMNHMGGKGITFKYQKKTFHITVSDVKVYPQGYAAAYANKPRIGPNEKREVPDMLLAENEDYVVCDIGGMTCDIIPFRENRPVIEYTITENLGIATLLKDLIKEVKGATGYRLDEKQIINFLQHKKNTVPEEAHKTIIECVNRHTDKILDKIEENVPDIRLSIIVFVGGGANLLMDNIKESKRITAKYVTFIKEQNANAKGYLLITGDLYKNQKKKK